MRSKLDRQSRSFETRRRRRKATGWVAGMAALAAWTFVLYSLASHPALAISKIEIFGVEVEAAPVMESAAWKAMEGRYVGIFPRASTLMYPDMAIVREVASSSPRVHSVKVSKSGLNSLAIAIAERTPEAVVCADLPDLTESRLAESDRCYFADARGYLFKPLRSSRPQGMPVIYTPGIAPSGPAMDLSGTFATSTERFLAMKGLMAELVSAGIGARGLLLKDGRDIEIYADNPDGASMVVIKMDDRSPFWLQRENLVAFWHKVTADGRANGALPSWTEIKAQYPPNIYYR